MALPLYLAQTAAEFTSCSSSSWKPAWMACHFSPYSTGLSNLPPRLPKGSLLILNDRTPPQGHDSSLIADQLQRIAQDAQCRGILLDFQRPGDEETAAIARIASQGLCCPVAVSDVYAADLPCPVFLPPPPLHICLKEYLTPWQGREIWLEAALTGAVVTVTAQGSDYRECALCPVDLPHWDRSVHCHYRIAIAPEELTFTLGRTRQDLDTLLEEAAALGVTTAVGLHQQLA